jgi:hypothetical protein
MAIKRDSKGRFAGSGGGKSPSRMRTRSTVQDTIRQQTPKGAAKAVAKRGGNALQQRAAANKAALKDMRRSSSRNAAARRMMQAAFS